MLRITIHISLFLAVIVLGVMLFPIERQHFYYGLTNDCFGHGKWMYDRIYRNNEEVNIAFIGSSHTINGINDQIVESYLTNKEVLNFGYCRHGRNLDYLLAAELIEKKTIECLIVEVRKYENAYSHPVYPYLATNKDLVTNYPFFNPNWFSNISLAFQYRVQLIQDHIWNNDSVKTPSNNLYGFAGHYDTINPKLLFAEEQERNYVRSEWKKEFDHVFPMHYNRKLATLCAENSIELRFLYIPSFNESLDQPYKLQELNILGEVLIPPSEIWTNPDNWHDPNHLNVSGAKALSEWVGKKLKS